jgi:hypothetical protein
VLVFIYLFSYKMSSWTPDRRTVPEIKVQNPEVIAVAIAKGLTPEAVEPDAVYVGNVDYSVTSEMLKEIFGSCGVLLRVTIPRNKKDNTPMGFAYLKFDLEQTPDAVSNARTLDGMELGGRKLKVTEKRINVPGLKTRCPYTEGHEHKETTPQLRSEGNSGNEWMCPSCGAMCYARRTECFKCKTARPLQGIAQSSSAAGPIRNRKGVIATVPPPSLRYKPYVYGTTTATNTIANPPPPYPDTFNMESSGDTTTWGSSLQSYYVVGTAANSITTNGSWPPRSISSPADVEGGGNTVAGWGTRTRGGVAQDAYPLARPTFVMHYPAAQQNNT